MNSGDGKDYIRFTAEANPIRRLDQLFLQFGFSRTVGLGRLISNAVKKHPRLVESSGRADRRHSSSKLLSVRVELAASTIKTITQLADQAGVPRARVLRRIVILAVDDSDPFGNIHDLLVRDPDDPDEV
jgi:hypothetical protein